MTNKSIGNIIIGSVRYIMTSLEIETEERTEKKELLGMLPCLPPGILLTTYEHLHISVEIVGAWMDIDCLGKTPVPVKILGDEKKDCPEVLRCLITNCICRGDTAKLTMTTPPKKAYERLVKF